MASTNRNLGSVGLAPEKGKLVASGLRSMWLTQYKLPELYPHRTFIQFNGLYLKPGVKGVLRKRPIHTAMVPHGTSVWFWMHYVKASYKQLQAIGLDMLSFKTVFSIIHGGHTVHALFIHCECSLHSYIVTQILRSKVVLIQAKKAIIMLEKII